MVIVLETWSRVADADLWGTLPGLGLGFGALEATPAPWDSRGGDDGDGPGPNRPRKLKREDL